VRRALVRQLRLHPALIRNGQWLRKASLFSVQIPAVLQLTSPSPSDNTATLDLGSVGAGSHTLRLAGEIPAVLHFNDTYDIGYPGDIEVSFPSGTSTPLTTSSVPLEVDSYMSNTQTATTPGCGDFSATGGYGGTAAGVDDPTLLGDYPSQVSSVNDVGPAPYDTVTSDSNPEDVKVRTGPMQLAIAGGANSGGTANLFGLAPVGDQPVRLHINFSAQVSTLIRVAPSDSTYGALDTYFQCRQFWTGTETDALSADLAGTMQMSPALTANGSVRLATLQLSSPDTSPVSFLACLDPYQTLAAGDVTTDPFYPAGPSATSPYINPSTASGRSAVACGATGGPLDRVPFNFMPTGQSETLTGQLSVANLTLELLLGNAS